MKTGLITSDTYQDHNTGEGHPEKIDRVTAVIDNFKRLDNKNLILKVAFANPGITLSAELSILILVTSRFVG